MTKNKAIVIKGLCKEYVKSDSSQGSFLNKIRAKKNGESFYAIKDFNIAIDEGDVIGIIGPNGAGKSTLLKTIAEVTPPTKGTIELNGKVASILQVGIGFQPELSGYENIFISGRLYGLSKQTLKTKIDEIIKMFGFPDFIHTAVKYYSSGMYMRLAFAMIAHVDADIYLLDEVLSVGDLTFRDKVLNMISEMSQNGKTILLVTHAPDTVYAYCDKIAIMNKGELLEFGEPQHCIAKYNLLAYENNPENKIDKKDFENTKIVFDKEVAETFSIKNVNANNLDEYFNGQNIEIEIDILKNNANKLKLSVVLKDNLNKPIAELKGKEFTEEEGNHKICVSIPPNILNSFTYIIDIFVYGETKLAAIYPKSIKFHLKRDNKKDDFCMLELNDLVWKQTKQ